MKNKKFMGWIAGKVDTGVVIAVTSLLMTWQVAAWASASVFLQDSIGTFQHLYKLVQAKKV